MDNANFERDQKNFCKIVERDRTCRPNTRDREIC